MPIINKKDWKEWVHNNKDPYGKTCVDVAREVMRMLDEGAEMNVHELINQADKQIGAGGITGFMAGCVAQMVSHCHSRGPEFLAVWNRKIQISTEGKSNKRR
ncbi:MAG: hypothetical protein DRO67_00165 [Candidatus Asgardarchaeum californiense]|nr:MAG: hypothetical protein DRO67_00165 [Candidatus Asgardarchaeum californiense]